MFILEQKRKKDLIPEARIVLSIHIPFRLYFFSLCSWLSRTLSLTIPGPQVNAGGLDLGLKFPSVSSQSWMKQKLASHNEQGEACEEVGAPVSLCSFSEARGWEPMTHPAQNTSLEKAWRMGPQGAHAPLQLGSGSPVVREGSVFLTWLHLWIVRAG